MRCDMQKILTSQTSNNSTVQSKSNLSLINRQALSITGITNVSSYSETTVVASLPDTRVTIKGTKMSIQKLDIDNGILEIDGTIDSIVYGKSNIMRKLFK